MMVTPAAFSSTAHSQTIGFYNQNAQSYFQRTISIDMADSYQRFIKHLPRGARVLDGGCGSGRDAKHFLTQGYTVVAMDASKEMVKLSSEYIGQPTLHLSFEEMEFENEFDGIWCNASLLHVPSNQIMDVFQKIKMALKPEGIWFLSFLKGTTEDFNGERFYHYVTEDTLASHIEKTGSLEILEIGVEKSQEANRKDLWVHCLVKKLPVKTLTDSL